MIITTTIILAIFYVVIVIANAAISIVQHEEWAKEYKRNLKIQKELGVDYAAYNAISEV